MSVGLRQTDFATSILKETDILHISMCKCTNGQHKFALYALQVYGIYEIESSFDYPYKSAKIAPYQPNHG